MSVIDSGGYAFPSSYESRPDFYGRKSLIVNGGMTLRDYFAAEAVKGLLSGQFSDHGHYNLNAVPQEAYRIADSMLKARK